jgi:hypothetical protein
MTREEMMSGKERGLAERKYYEDCTDLTEQLELPVTKEGFEALVEVACKAFELPVDDLSRQFVIEHIHHITAAVNTTSIEDVATILHKRTSNHTTWVIADEIRKRVSGEQAAKDAKTTPTLVPDPASAH